MTVSLARIVSPVHLPDGSLAPDGAKIIFTLTGWDKNATSIILGGASEAVVESGAIDTYVHRVGAGDRQSAILVASSYFNSASRRWVTEHLGTIAPNGPGPFDLADLLAIPAPVPTVPDALAQALGAAAAADADATQTAADRVQTGLDAAATAADADAVAADRIATEAARDAAFADANVYANTADGLAAVALSGQFQVLSPDAKESIRYREDVGPVATEVARYPVVTGILPSKFGGNDFRNGASGWTVSGMSTTSWDTQALTVTRVYTSGGTGWTGRIFKTVSGGVILQANHRYAFYADLQLQNNATSNVDSVACRPFMLSGPGSGTVATRIKCGASGYPIRSRIATIFDEAADGSRGNPYIDLTLARDLGNQNLAAFDVKIEYTCFMLIDLGVQGDRFFDVAPDDLANIMSEFGAPYHPRPSGVLYASQVAAHASVATRADHATSSETSDLALLAEAVRSPWQGKRLGIFGHSLVTPTWANHTVQQLGMSGLSFYGIGGGKVQPTPGDFAAKPGFYSRDYWTDAITLISNTTVGGISSVGLSGLTLDAVVIWVGANDPIKNFANTPGFTLLLDSASTDRVMTIAEQDEFDTRCATVGANLSAPLTTGLVPTYATLIMTMIKNFYAILGPYINQSTRVFMVKEPQAFWEYDGTFDWPHGHYERNLIHVDVAQKMGLPLIDMWSAGINMFTKDIFLLAEAGGKLWIHHSQKGGLLHGTHAARTLLNYPPLDFGSLSGGSLITIPSVASDLGPWLVDNVV